MVQVRDGIGRAWSSDPMIAAADPVLAERRQTFGSTEVQYRRPL